MSTSWKGPKNPQSFQAIMIKQELSRRSGRLKSGAMTTRKPPLKFSRPSTAPYPKKGPADGNPAICESNISSDEQTAERSDDAATREGETISHPAVDLDIFKALAPRFIRHKHFHHEIFPTLHPTTHKITSIQLFLTPTSNDVIVVPTLKDVVTVNQS
ncbi:hypothetical protein Ae201684P_012078 [Aphanomyces euteiches]|nr:hypothetical protein Ae201684P_012078 [Aphanomyces euteiches]